MGLLGSAFPLSFSKAQALLDQLLVVEISRGAIGNADGNNPTGKRGWQWGMVMAVVTVFLRGLSRSTAAASSCSAMPLAGLW